METVIDSQTVHASATITVPDYMEINMDYYDHAVPDSDFADEEPQVYPKVKYELINDDYPVFCRFDNDDVVYSYYNFYCMEDFSTDLEFTVPFMDYTHLEEEDEGAYNNPMEKNFRESNMLWRYIPQHFVDDYILLNDYYANGFTFYGKYRLTIYSVDLNFYTYKYHSESYFHGGINGGIGYFGTVSGEDYYTEVVK